ncbi:MAG: hypothetical protein KDD40_00755, partial [Bdellovibrionales bacterium]|nr:hypothetical protein [Bdellovibrionales bacterium]
QESIIRAHKLCRHQVNDELLGKGILKNSKIPPKCSAYKQYILRATLDSDDADLLIDVKNLVHHKKMIAGYHFAEKDIVGHKKYVQGNRASRLSIQEINETEFVKVTTGEGNNWEVIVKIDSQGKRNYFRRPANSQVDWQPVTNKDSQFIENIKEAAVFDKPITSTVSRGNSATSHVAQKVQSINPSSGDVVYVDIEGGGRAVATFVKKSDGEEVLRFADPRKGFSEVEVAVKNADAKGIHNIEPHGLYAKKSSTTQSHVKEPPTETAKAIDSPGVQVSKPNLTATKPATPESAQIPRVTANTPIENLRPPENIHSRVYNEQWLPVKENYLNMRERAAQAADKLKNAEKEQATAQRIYERNKPAFDGFSNYRNANIEYLKTQKQLQQLEDRISASKKTVNIKNKHLDRKIEKARKQEALAEKYKQFSAGLRSATRENAERAKLADSHVANRQAELLQRQTKGDTAQSTPGKIAEEQRQLRLQQQVHYREAQPDFNVEEAKSAYESLNNTRHQLRILEQQRMKGDSELASMIEEQQKLKRQMDSHKRRMDVNAHHHKNVDKDRYTRVIDRVRAAERSLSESREQLATAQANEQRAKKMLIDRHHQLKGHK